MKKIKLTQGKFALVSGIDFAYLSQWEWYACWNGHVWSAIQTKTNSHIRMHRIVLARKLGHANFKLVDHKDSNGLNNQRGNLRPATVSQNQCNRKTDADNTSGYKGVNWSEFSNKWRARIQIRGRQKHLGYFPDKLDAAKAYNKAAKKYHGAFARLNKV